MKISDLIDDYQLNEVAKAVMEGKHDSMLLRRGLFSYHEDWSYGGIGGTLRFNHVNIDGVLSPYIDSKTKFILIGSKEKEHYQVVSESRKIWLEPIIRYICDELNWHEASKKEASRGIWIWRLSHWSNTLDIYYRYQLSRIDESDFHDSSHLISRINGKYSFELTEGEKLKLSPE